MSQDLLSEESALVYAHNKLKEKDRKIYEYQIQAAEIQKKLEYEMMHSDHVTDLNVRLKEENDSLRERLKVRVLPTSLTKLQHLAQDQDLLIQKLRRALVAALDMIEETDANKDDVAALKRLYQKIA